MKYCPQCNKQFTDAWLSFCSDDGTLLVEELTPAVDPNWDPRVREPKFDTPSEQATKWLPRQPPAPGGWLAPDERPPLSHKWHPPPPPPSYVKPPSQGLAIASMITGIIGLLFGGFCLGPVPGIVALILGLVALSQIKKSPDRNGGKPFAIAGVITGGISIVFYVGLLLLFIFARAFG